MRQRLPNGAFVGRILCNGVRMEAAGLARPQVELTTRLILILPQHGFARACKKAGPNALRGPSFMCGWVNKRLFIPAASFLFLLHKAEMGMCKGGSIGNNTGLR